MRVSGAAFRLALCAPALYSLAFPPSSLGQVSNSSYLSLDATLKDLNRADGDETDMVLKAVAMARCGCGTEAEFEAIVSRLPTPAFIESPSVQDHRHRTYIVGFATAAVCEWLLRQESPKKQHIEAARGALEVIVRGQVTEGDCKGGWGYSIKPLAVTADLSTTSAAMMALLQGADLLAALPRENAMPALQDAIANGAHFVLRHEQPGIGFRYNTQPATTPSRAMTAATAAILAAVAECPSITDGLRREYREATARALRYLSGQLYCEEKWIVYEAFYLALATADDASQGATEAWARTRDMLAKVGPDTDPAKFHQDFGPMRRAALATAAICTKQVYAVSVREDALEVTCPASACVDGVHLAVTLAEPAQVSGSLARTADQGPFWILPINDKQAAGTGFARLIGDLPQEVAERLRAKPHGDGFRLVVWLCDPRGKRLSSGTGVSP